MRTAIFFLFLYLLPINALAADKVVVVPMGSSAKGVDGQVQYNDNGSTAGAEVFYDKATGKLETIGEVRTVDESGANRLWGKGRPGTELLPHTDPNGYCTASSGIHYALSATRANWHTVAEVCPAGTWVCSENDFPDSGSCEIQPVTGYAKTMCNGTNEDYDTHDSLEGWISDLTMSPEMSDTKGAYSTEVDHAFHAKSATCSIDFGQAVGA